MTDPIADMLTRIRNAVMAKKKEVLVPYSKVKFNIAKLLEKNGWLGKVEIVNPFQNLKRQKSIPHQFKQFIACYLIYDENNQSKIRGLRRISKPGCRIYVKKDEIRPVCDGYGLGIVSTSQGLLTDQEARKKNIGGEYICEIW